MSVNDERADEGFEHLQTAAQEMIEAARAFLDVAEELVTDPKTADSLLGFFNSVAGAAAKARPGRGGDDDGDDDQVHHIPVS